MVDLGSFSSADQSEILEAMQGGMVEAAAAELHKAVTIDREGALANVQRLSEMASKFSPGLESRQYVGISVEDENATNSTRIYLSKVATAEVLPGPRIPATDLETLVATATALDKSLADLAELIDSFGPVTVSRATLIPGWVCAYVTADDVEYQLETRSHLPPFDLEISVAVYEETQDSWVPKFEHRQQASSLVSLVEVMASFTHDLLQAARGYGTELSPENIVDAAQQQPES